MAEAKNMIHCIDCGKLTRPRGNGRCGACYMRNRRANAEIAPCKNCLREKQVAHRGLCKACYNHEQRHGEPRPLRLIHRQAKVAAVTDNTASEKERICLATGCTTPALETAPWGLGFCETCMPKIERLLISHYNNKNRAKGLAA